MMLKLGIYDMKLVNVYFFLSVILFTTHYLPISTKTFDCMHNYRFFCHIFVKIMLKLRRKCDLYSPTVCSILAEWCHVFKLCKKGLKADEMYYTLRNKEILSS